MRTFIEFLRFVVISVEFIIILVAITLYLFFSDYIISLTALISEKTEIIKHLALVPSFITVAVFKKGRSLLFPEKDKKEILQHWPDYFKLRIGFEVATIYSVVFATIGFIGWTLDWSKSSPVPALSLFTALSGSTIVFYTIYKADIKINEIFIKENDRLIG
jgi:hypothetical protein